MHFASPTVQNELRSGSRPGSSPGSENRTGIVLWDRFEGGKRTVHGF